MTCISFKIFLNNPFETGPHEHERRRLYPHGSGRWRGGGRRGTGMETKKMFAVASHKKRPYSSSTRKRLGLHQHYEQQQQQQQQQQWQRLRQRQEHYSFPFPRSLPLPPPSSPSLQTRLSSCWGGRWREGKEWRRRRTETWSMGR